MWIPSVYGKGSGDEGPPAPNGRDLQCGVVDRDRILKAVVSMVVKVIVMIGVTCEL